MFKNKCHHTWNIWSDSLGFMNLKCQVCGEYEVAWKDGGHYLTEDEYQEYRNIKKWYKLSKQGNLITDEELKEYQGLKKFKADADKEEWDKGIKWTYHTLETPPNCSVTFDQETLEDRETRRWEDHVRYHENLLDNQLVAEDTLKDRLDDLECEIRQINKDLGDFKHTQKLINKIVQEQICEIVEDLKNVRQNTYTCGSTTKPRKGKEKSAGSVGK